MAYYNGKPACECQAEWLAEFEVEAQRRGIVRGSLPLSQIIGGAKTSGGTHSTGGADDSYPLTNVVDINAYVWLSRQMGADATWLRRFNWDGRGGVEHVHRVLTDCPHNGPARYQIDAVRAGYNGLGSGGRGAPDDGPRPLSGRTWREGIAWARQQREDFNMDATEAKNLFREVLREELAADRKKDRERMTRLINMLNKIRGEVKDDATKRDLDAAVRELQG